MFAAAAQSIAAPCVANRRVSSARQVKSTKAPRAATVAAAAAEEPGSDAKGMGKNLPAAMDINAVMNLLPHRYPFLLVDRVVEIETGSYAIGVKNVTINDNFFPGHFPQRPIMPGVLMVEAMAQVGGLVMLEPGEEGEYAPRRLKNLPRRRESSAMNSSLLTARASRTIRRRWHPKGVLLRRHRWRQVPSPRRSGRYPRDEGCPHQAQQALWHRQDEGPVLRRRRARVRGRTHARSRCVKRSRVSLVQLQNIIIHFVSALRIDSNRRVEHHTATRHSRDGSTDDVARNGGRVDDRRARARATDDETERGGARGTSRIRGADADCFDCFSIIGTGQEKEEESAGVVFRGGGFREWARTSRERDASSARSRLWRERSSRGVGVFESARGDAIQGALVLRPSVLARIAKETLESSAGKEEATRRRMNRLWPVSTA